MPVRAAALMTAQEAPHIEAQAVSATQVQAVRNMPAPAAPRAAHRAHRNTMDREVPPIQVLAVQRMQAQGVPAIPALADLATPAQEELERIVRQFVSEVGSDTQEVRSSDKQDGRW